MKTIIAVTVAASFGIAPAIAVACDLQANAAEASKAGPDQMAATPAPVRTSAAQTANAPGTATVAKAAVEIKIPAADAKVASTVPR